jgi:hypothetical protein
VNLVGNEFIYSPIKVLLLFTNVNSGFLVNSFESFAQLWVCSRSFCFPNAIWTCKDGLEEHFLMPNDEELMCFYVSRRDGHFRYSS